MKKSQSNMSDSFGTPESKKETLHKSGFAKMSPLDLLERQSRKLAISPKNNASKRSDNSRTNLYNSYTYGQSSKKSAANGYSDTGTRHDSQKDTIKVVQYAAPPLQRHVMEENNEWSPRDSTTSLISTSTSGLGGNILDGLRLSSLPGYDPDAVSIYSVDTVDSYPEQVSHQLPLNSRTQHTVATQAPTVKPPSPKTGTRGTVGGSSSREPSAASLPQTSYSDHEETNNDKTPTQENYPRDPRALPQAKLFDDSVASSNLPKDHATEHLSYPSEESIIQHRAQQQHNGNHTESSLHAHGFSVSTQSSHPEGRSIVPDRLSHKDRYSIESSQSASSLSTGSPSIHSFQTSLSSRGHSPQRALSPQRNRQSQYSQRGPSPQRGVSPHRRPQASNHSNHGNKYFFPTGPSTVKPPQSHHNPRLAESRSPLPILPLLSKRGSSPIRNRPQEATTLAQQHNSPRNKSVIPNPQSPERQSSSLNTTSRSPKTPPSSSRMATIAPNLTRNISNSSALSRSPATPTDGLEDKKSLSEMTLEEHVSKGIDAHEAGNLRESSYHWQFAAHKGDPTAQLLYGLALRHGWGVRQNPQEAVQWLRRAMESSLGPDFQSNDFGEIALRISEMTTVADEKTKINRAHVALALYELGMSYLHSWGIEKDETKALAAFEAAGELDDADALCEAAALYMHNGPKRKKDLQKASKLYRRAGELGASMVGESWIYKDKYLTAEEKKKDKKKK